MYKKTSGIYCLFNLANHNFYIGRSGDIRDRLNAHINTLCKKEHPNKLIQEDWESYPGLFIWFVIEVSASENLIQLEQHYLDKLQPPYNICKHSLAPMAGRRHSSETLALFKLRPVKKGEGHYMYGKRLSPERRARMAEVRRGTKHSEETKNKMKRAAIERNAGAILESCREKRMRAVMDNHGNTFDSVTSAARHWEMSPATVCDNLKGRSKKTKKGVVFKYA